MLEPLTKRQKEILNFLKNFLKNNEYPPSFEEIRDHLNLKAISTIHEHLENLKRKGYIHKEMNQSRGILSICSVKEKNVITVPIIGKLFSNREIQRTRKTVYIDTIIKSTRSDQEFFALTIEDKGFLDESIIPKDIIIIHKTKKTKNGEVILVYTNKAKIPKIRRYKKVNNRIKLHALDDPRKYNSYNNIEIVGVVKKIMRNFVST